MPVIVNYKCIKELQLGSRRKEIIISIQDIRVWSHRMESLNRRHPTFHPLLRKEKDKSNLCISRLCLKFLQTQNSLHQTWIAVAIINKLIKHHWLILLQQQCKGMIIWLKFQWLRSTPLMVETDAFCFLNQHKIAKAVMETAF